MRGLVGDCAAQRFARLCLFPGVAHRGGGLGPDTFDVLTPVMAWVETGAAPRAITASKVGGTSAGTRTLFPHPAVARHAGSGSTDDAANFTAFTPQ